MRLRFKPLLIAAGFALGVASTPAPAQDAGWLVGLGIGYQKSEDNCPGAALRLEWQHYNDVGDPATTGRFNVDVFGVSALISF